MTLAPLSFHSLYYNYQVWSKIFYLISDEGSTCTCKEKMLLFLKKNTTQSLYCDAAHKPDQIVFQFATVIYH